VTFNDNTWAWDPAYKVTFGADEMVQTNKYAVSMSRDDAGNEVISIRFNTKAMTIPEGGYMDVYISARNPTQSYINRVFTNRAMLTPNTQTFKVSDVANGRVMRNVTGELLGVESAAPMTVSFGYATTSENQVTDKADTENDAVSSDPAHNRITLANATDPFTYTLTVKNDTDQPMTKLVLIDTLPQPNDTSLFDDSVNRGSEFTVVLAEQLNFVVQVEAEDGTVSTLDPDRYTVEYSTSNKFGTPFSEDWNGLDTGKWNAKAEEARAVRIVLKDDTGALIPAKSTVRVSFDAKVLDPEEVEPGQITWNNFGYHYAIKDVKTELEAMPLDVGVTIPQEWKLQKKLVDPQGKPAMTSGEETFTFLLYEGEALTEGFGSKEDWITALEDAGRPYGEFTATVPAGSTESQPVLLDWTWKTGASYTLVEMPVGDGYRTESLGGSTGNSHTFRYDPKRAVTMECVNVLEHWSIHLTKTDEKGKVLPGAVFALYSPDPADQIQIPAEYSRIDISATRKRGEDSWYLADVSESDEDGEILWDALLRDSYLVLEVKAPAGYKLPDSEGELVYRSSAVGLVKELNVVNYSGYELPETGGVGTGIFTILGLGLTGISGILGILTRRRKNR
jgi:LPXTG-motif cell wall-anchored protein/uncharacterized repeat protein (TIGR01451 family)